MNFQRRRSRDEPEINLIPMIDVLLVILIFLMVTTTYSRYSELQINLPQADANQPQERPNQINVAVNAEGQYVINKTRVQFTNVEQLGAELKRAGDGLKDPIVIISADKKADFQSVVQVMEASRLVGLTQITFTTQSSK